MKKRARCHCQHFTDQVVQTTPTNCRAHDLYTPTAPLKVQVLLLAVRLIRVVDARPDAPLALLAQALGN